MTRTPTPAPAPAEMQVRGRDVHPASSADDTAQATTALL
jgi:hypothetical protein